MVLGRHASGRTVKGEIGGSDFLTICSAAHRRRSDTIRACRRHVALLFAVSFQLEVNPTVCSPAGVRCGAALVRDFHFRRIGREFLVQGNLFVE